MYFFVCFSGKKTRGRVAASDSKEIENSFKVDELFYQHCASAPVALLMGGFFFYDLCSYFTVLTTQGLQGPDTDIV
jgi:hypothetical protein